MEATTSRAHFFYIDILRIVSTLGVIAIHMPYAAKIQCFEWQRDFVMSALNCFARFAVPVFFMISGACNLNRADFSFPKLFRKAGRLLLILFFWSTLYGAIAFFSEKESYGDLFHRILFGHYHLWFLYALFGLYLAIPILNNIMKDGKLALYFMILIVIFKDLPALLELTGVRWCVNGKHLLAQFSMEPISEFTLYFMAGYYLHNLTLSRKVRIVLYISGALSCLATIFLTACISNGRVYNEYFLYCQNPTILLWASAIFTFVKYSAPENLSEKSCRRLAWLGRATLGIYLVHPLILSMIYPLFKKPFGKMPFLTSLVLIPTLFVLALLLTTLLKKIKFLRNIV